MSIIVIVSLELQDIHFGEKFSRDFVDAKESGDTAEGLMNLHNNEAGRRVSEFNFLHPLEINDEPFYKQLFNLFLVDTIKNAEGLQMPWYVRILQRSRVLA